MPSASTDAVALGTAAGAGAAPVTFAVAVGTGVAGGGVAGLVPEGVAPAALAFCSAVVTVGVPAGIEFVLPMPAEAAFRIAGCTNSNS